MTQNDLYISPDTQIDVQAEQSVLGAVFLDKTALDDIRFLEDRDFNNETHQLIYKVMKYLDDRDIPVDLVTVTQEFAKFDRAQEMGGPSYLTKLAQAAPSSANARYYASIVRSAALRRRGSLIGNQIRALAHEHFESDEDYFSSIEDLVDELRPGQTQKMQSLAEIREDYFKHLTSSPEKLSTVWFKQFDAWSQLWRGWLYIIAGRPSVGKTAKALQLLHGIAIGNPTAGPVLIWSQEMGKAELIDRMVSMVTQINYPRLIDKGGEGGFTDEEYEKITDAYDRIERLKIFVQDSAGITIDEIRATVKQFKKRYGQIAAVIVDYLQIMEIPQKRSETRAQAIGHVTRSAKSMARRHKFVFIMLSQLDRAVDDEEPKLRHLKESGSIEQDADVVEFLWYNAKDQTQQGKKIIDSIFAKGRNVGTNRFKLEFRWWNQMYVEQPREQSDKPRKAGRANGRNTNTNKK